MRPLLANKTIKTIEQALEDKKSTAIIEILRVIQELAGKAFSISIPDLSNLIGRDAAITEKVISASNTLGFNPNGVPILTISDAIHTIGFDTVRNLALSLMLAETAGQKRHTYEQREMAALCVCSGLLAHSLAKEKRAAAEPDVVFVCSSLRNYGKLLMAAFMIDRFRHAKSLALDLPEEEAYREAFGITPLALGRHMLRGTTLPKSIMNSLCEVEPKLLERPAEIASEQTLILSELAGEVCAIAFDDKIGPDRFNAAVSNALERYSRCLPVSLESVNVALRELEQTMTQLNRAVGLAEGASASSAKLTARVTGEVLPPPPRESQTKPLPREKTFAEMDADEREAHAESAFEKAFSALAKNVVPGSKFSLREIYQGCAQAIWDGLGLDDCLVFVREELDPDKLSARYGIGPLFQKVKNRPLVSPSKGDVFSLCLTRKEDIHIQDITKGKIVSVIPEWLTEHSGTTSFVVLPAVLEKRVFAIIVGAVGGGRSIQLEEGDLARLRHLRAQLADMARMIEEQTVKAV